VSPSLSSLLSKARQRCRVCRTPRSSPPATSSNDSSKKVANINVIVIDERQDRKNEHFTPIDSATCSVSIEAREAPSKAKACGGFIDLKQASTLNDEATERSHELPQRPKSIVTVDHRAFDGNPRACGAVHEDDKLAFLFSVSSNTGRVVLLEPCQQTENDSLNCKPIGVNFGIDVFNACSFFDESDAGHFDQPSELSLGSKIEELLGKPQSIRLYEYLSAIRKADIESKHKLTKRSEVKRGAKARPEVASTTQPVPASTYAMSIPRFLLVTEDSDSDSDSDNDDAQLNSSNESLPIPSIQTFLNASRTFIKRWQALKPIERRQLLDVPLRHDRALLPCIDAESLSSSAPCYNRYAPRRQPSRPQDDTDTSVAPSICEWCDQPMQFTLQTQLNSKFRFCRWECAQSAALRSGSSSAIRRQVTPHCSIKILQTYRYIILLYALKKRNSSLFTFSIIIRTCHGTW